MLPTLRTLLFAACLFAGACARPPPEEALRARVASLQAAVERRDARAVAEHLAADFIGPEGLDREGARRLAQASFLRYRDVGVGLGPMQVALREAHATVRFTAALTGGEGLLPERGRVYDVTTGWRVEDGEWMLVSAEWTQRL
ncbi:nuclear transport factor 2 family protein [Vulcaniibacterium gelatinicum]|uniref:nuclear transport factor 2 family protein n=1 Tax=Vulcaniibacterium gelatinicum TaxID=2598725 RepID=UPI0011C786C7|nr:nuclear transport factor 2 family protein [Vulcaniibacterium gelatinicum]